MTKNEKKIAIDKLKDMLNHSKNVYLTDISGMNSEETFKLRKLCFTNGVTLQVVKNTLLKKAMESCEKNFDDISSVLKGNTSVMISDTSNAPAKVIKEFLSKNKSSEKPSFKGAQIDEAYYDQDQLAILENLKSKEELIGDIVLILQSPMKNIISSINSASNKLAGILKTLENKKE